MKTLTESCREQAFDSLESARKSLHYATRFTEAFQQAESLPFALRESALLRVQFPACLQAPMPGHHLAGGIRYEVVGHSPEPMGLGWYFDHTAVRDWMADPRCTGEDRTAWQELSHYWKPRTTQAKIRAAMPDEVARVLPSDHWVTESGVGFPLYRLAGTTLDYATLLRLGLDGLEQKAASMQAESSFRQACIEVVILVRDSLRWYESVAVDAGMRRTLQAILHHPPRTLRQAMQLMWIYALLSGTWNYGRLDEILGPFLEADLKAGRLKEPEALDLMCDFWLRMNEYSNQYNNRVWIGGKGRSHEAAADRFALLAIEATRRLKKNQPQLSLRVHSTQCPELWERALDAIGEGCTFPMLYNDEVNIPALANAFEISEGMAATYTPFGCGEATFSHHAMTTPNGVLNLLKALEVALHAGVDPLTGKCVVEGIPSPQDFTSFEEVWQAYDKVVQVYVKALARFQKLHYDIAAKESPFLLMSMLTDSCVERGVPLLQGGVQHLGGTLETYGNTNTADSLHALQELVFSQGILSLEELIQALDANFKGHETIQKHCLAVSKYGNDEGTADSMTQRVHDHICTLTRNQASPAGLDSYLVVIINNWANTVLGHHTSASAEGRYAGEPMANGNNPTPGSDHKGVTAFLNSLVQLDPSIHAGSVQNMKFSREWFGKNRPKFDALLRTYFSNGGTQAMITVVSREDLEAAIREPENWGHLLVRVGGFSIRFVDLPPDAQQEVLARTLH